MKSLNFSLSGGLVERYHTVPGVRQSVAEHSFNICHILYYVTNGNVSREALIYALHHDVAECETGDIPNYTKRGNKKLSGAVDEIENKVMLEVGLLHTLMDIKPEDKKLVKLADLCEAGLYAIHLEKMGNRNSKFILKETISALNLLMPFNNEKVTELYQLIFNASEKQSDIY